MPKKNNHSNLLKTYHDVGPYLGLGTQLAATIVLMFFLGRWLDGKFETDPVLTIAFSFFGGFAGIYNFIKTVLNMNKKKNHD
ncbi:MAG: AtpZ/AtpI family protein [Melioribacteraceae bacterium]|jgi:F0F1-type ATP synthase assembly protein I|nr:AtpZ/AtpI family protein [Melioribacteraceae bacterium]WKZ70534.1 MAG: AtpZ/AtpI family protein [Melioribacteraceae bacterium]